jgi:hypothetical protein
MPVCIKEGGGAPLSSRGMAPQHGGIDKSLAYSAAGAV